MSTIADWFMWLSEEQQRTIDAQNETIAGMGDFIEYQKDKDAKKHAAITKQSARLLAIACKLVMIDGWETEPFEEWPKSWPIQDEQGGCVLCGGHPKGSPLGQPELKDHEVGCAFRMAYNFLKEIKNENEKATSK